MEVNGVVVQVVREEVSLVDGWLASGVTLTGTHFALGN